MEVKQIYTLVNSITSEITGASDLLKEDLSNIADVGSSIFSATSTDKYVQALCDKIGKVIFVNRVYSGNAPSVLMNAWEYGSVLQKIQADIPQASENSSWELTNGTSYDTNVFYKPTVSSKFYNTKVTFEIPMSFTERQVKSAFNSASELNGFLSMIENSIEKSMTVKLDGLIMRTINNMTAQTVYDSFGAVEDNDYSELSSIKAVNLLMEYNSTFTGTIGFVPLTVSNCLLKPEFLKFCIYTLSMYKERMSKMSSLFNIGGKDRFTSADNLHTILLADFKSSVTAYLASDTFNKEMVELPKSETVPYWQGSGTNYSFANVSTINVSTQNPTGTGTVDVNIGGILGVMFDRDSLGVSNLERRVTSNYNAKAEFYNNYYKFESGFYNDSNENFVVFFIA